MMPSWVSTVMCPSVGLLVTTIMWLSPLRTVLRARERRDMGDINPLPFAFIVLNCTGWIVYSLVTEDMFIFWANISGLLLGLFYVVSSLVILGGQSKQGEPMLQSYRTLETLLIASFGFWCLVSVISVFAMHSRSVSRLAFQKLVVGSCVMVFNILYYAAPLSTIFQVVQQRDSSSILASLVAVNLLNASTWLAYGVALSDPTIIVPHSIGAVLACMQVTILFVFHKPRTSLNEDIELSTVYHVDLAHSVGKNKLNTTSLSTSSGRSGEQGRPRGGSSGDSVYNVYFNKFVGDEGENAHYHDIVLL